MDLEKIKHLPILKVEVRNEILIGYFDRKPIEIGEIVLRLPYNTDDMYNLPTQEINHNERIIKYILGRTSNGNLIYGDNLDDETKLVKKGKILFEILDYNPITSYNG